MTLEEIRAVLEKAMVVRVPQFDPNEHPGKKISLLEDHLMKCAWHRGELEEALHWCVEAGKLLRRQWDGIEGAEARVGSKATKDQLDREKARISPELWDSLTEARTLTESLRRQITRLGGSDYEAVSRAYTLISGS